MLPLEEPMIDPNNSTNPDDSNRPATEAEDVAAAEAEVPAGGSVTANAQTHMSEAASTAAADPINRWATVHYGFDEDSYVQAAQPAPSWATGSRLTARPRKRALLAAGVLGLILTGTVSGAAIAASGDDGRPGGRDGVAQFDHRDGGPDRGNVGGGRDGDSQ
jgi:hypothetical protein